MGIFETVALVCGAITAAGGAVALIAGPVRKRIKRNKARKQGDLAILRAHMLSIYYACRESKTIRQYELENFVEFYEAYAGQGGNSFMKVVHDEVITYDVIT